jgi:hypothetical protein
VEQKPTEETIVKMQHEQEVILLQSKIQRSKGNTLGKLFEIIYQTVQENNNELNVEMLCEMAGVSSRVSF